LVCSTPCSSIVLPFCVCARASAWAHTHVIVLGERPVEQYCGHRWGLCTNKCAQQHVHRVCT
jgi:hypothetical protein